LSKPGSGTGAQEARERVYADKTIRCRDCGMDFVFSAGEQKFYAEKGLVNEPQRCQSCRAIAKQNRALGIGGGNGGQREIARGRLRGVWRPGARPLPAEERSSGLLQQLLRQGPRPRLTGAACRAASNSPNAAARRRSCVRTLR